MEEAFLRFPHLSENIFDSLDNKSLADCKEVSKSWYFYLDTQKFLQIRIIKNVEETIERIQKIDFRGWPHKPWTDIDSKSMMENAKNGQFDLANRKIMMKIKECYNCDTRKSAFHNAAVLGHFNVVKYIMDRAEDKNPADWGGDTPLHEAAIQGHLAGDTPLHEAAIRGHLAIVKYMMDNINDKSPKNCYGKTPLHYAATWKIWLAHVDACIRKYEVFKYIFENVDEKNPEDLEGITPLHLAAKHPTTNFVKYIMNNIGDISPKDHNGKTPLHFAASSEQLFVFEYILEKVDEKNPRDNDGKTPLDLLPDSYFPPDFLFTACQSR
jgi:ankyrin repeat protein